MRNRFLAFEVYEEWFEGLNRLVPNLREIGLISDRIKPHYDEVGLMKYFGGRSADQITGDQMLAELDGKAVAPEGIAAA